MRLLPYYIQIQNTNAKPVIRHLADHGIYSGPTHTSGQGQICTCTAALFPIRENARVCQSLQSLLPPCEKQGRQKFQREVRGFDFTLRTSVSSGKSKGLNQRIQLRRSHFARKEQPFSNIANSSARLTALEFWPSRLRLRGILELVPTAGTWAWQEDSLPLLLLPQPTFIHLDIEITKKLSCWVSFRVSRVFVL